MFILLAIVSLGVLVFFHELGHFVVAKIFNIKVEEFGFGYPPRVCGWVCAGGKSKRCRRISRFKFFWGKKAPIEAETATIYSLNSIPFGGFNKLKGELGDSQEKDSFSAQVWWKKALVSFGGVGMNILLAIFIFSLCFFIGIPQDISQPLPGGRIVRQVGIQIGMITAGSPAAQAELRAGDVIVSINAHEFQTVSEIQDYIKAKVDQSIEIKVKRREEIIVREVNVLSAKDIFKDIEESYGVIGIALAKIGIVAYPWYQAVFEGVKTTFLLAGRLFHGLWLILKTLLVKQKMLGEFFGPVGITMMVGEIARIGFVYFLQFVAFLSVAIGVFQLIPFPALDGSRILFAFIEGIRRRPINHKAESLIVGIGFYLLLLLLVFITYRELIRLGEKFFR